MIKTIILDDEMIIRMGLEKIIRENVEEIEVVALAGNGKECIEILNEQKVELIITDIRMPHMDGLELIRALDEQKKAIDFIVISGYDDFNYCKTALQYRVWDYVLKPIDKNEFISTLKRFIDNKKRKNFQKNVSENIIIYDDKKIIIEIKRYLRSHYNQDVSLREMSEKFYLSTGYISQLFRKETDLTITGYLLKIKMEMACIALKDGTKRINEIAENVGYKNPRQFATMFKRYYGITPSQYREQIR